MSAPLAIVFYDRLMPGSQLVNRLQDSGYRVLPANNPAQLAPMILREMPMVVFVDLAARGDIPEAIRRIKDNPATAHVPVIGFAPDEQDHLMTLAQQAGAILAVGETTLSGHLPTLLEQALHLD